MDKDLERRIKERKERGKRKKIYMKANLIAESLGWSYCTSRASLDEYIYEGRRDTYGAPKFENNKFKIDGGNLTSIIYEGKEVYSASYVHENLKNIKSYLPGEWEKEFEEIYFQAQAKSEETKHNRVRETVEKVKRDRAREEEDLKRRFGL